MDHHFTFTFTFTSLSLPQPGSLRSHTQAVGGRQRMRVKEAGALRVKLARFARSPRVRKGSFKKKWQKNDKLGLKKNLDPQNNRDSF